MTVIVCCGMSSEAAIIGQRSGVLTVVGAGNATALASNLESAIAAGDAKYILSTGVAGALAPDLRVGDVIVGVSVCDEAGTIIHCDQGWANRISGALRDSPQPVTFPVSFGNIVSTIAPVATEAQRAALHASTGADVVDMESWVSASAAKVHGVPFVALRVVLDRYDFDLPPAALLPFTPSGGNDIEAILGSVMSNPFQIPALMRLMDWSEKAMGNLAVGLDVIGTGFEAIG